ncbi:hypothetical protein DCAR_0414625 [Daucus carota subsp. sativus]|uniref:Uncharacterized protein n=1 Tax=Daucus carota subsp. sativus TaxID=79200 RepID=A0A175YE55_DAUCS|nr:hypothetical protein DCAR_0414625 [Daucus carota subsp. sativus]
MATRIIEVGIDYENEIAVTYKLFHPRIKGHVNHTDFDKDFKNQRSEDTRSIYFFELKRMIEILEDDTTITPEILNPVYDYYDLREKQYKDVYGDWRMHDDSDYLNNIEEEQVDVAPDDVIDLTADDEDEQPRQPPWRNPTEAQ